MEERIAPGCGLTKREWFTGMVLTGMMVNDVKIEGLEFYADTAIEVADMVMAKLAKPREGGEVAAEFSDGTAEYGVGKEN